MQLDVIQKAARDVLKQSSLPRPKPPQSAVWLSVRDNPDKLLGYVQQRTGLSGNDLLREVAAYTSTMKERYG